MTNYYKYLQYSESEIAIIRNYRIKQWDWLLIIGSVMAPMTGLRVTKVGPAEMLCFIWAIRYLSPCAHRNAFTRFFTFFLSAMLIGTLVGLSVVPDEVSLSGWFTWIYLSYIACTLFSVISNNDLLYNEKIFDLICRLSVVWYLFLYIFSVYVKSSFLGAPLWYYNRFTGGGTNPHQIAVMFCGISFWFLRQVDRKRNYIGNIISFIVAVFLVFKTASDTGFAAIITGLLTFVFVNMITSVHDRRKRAILVALEIMVIIILFILYNNNLYQIIYNWVASDKNGLDRFYLWASVKQMAVKSPIFGLGPGIHAVTARGNIIEFHNSYIEIYAASGVLGFIALIIFSARYLYTLKEGDLYLLPIMASMYMYAVAGFALRRLAFWVIAAFTYMIAMQLIYAKKDRLNGQP